MHMPEISSLTTGGDKSWFLCLSIASKLQEYVKIEGWQFKHFKIVNAQFKAIVINITCIFSLWTTVTVLLPAPV